MAMPDDPGSDAWDEAPDVDVVYNSPFGDERTIPSGNGFDVPTRTRRSDSELRFDWATPPRINEGKRPSNPRGGGYARGLRRTEAESRMGTSNNGELAEDERSCKSSSGSNSTRAARGIREPEATPDSTDTGEPGVGGGRRLAVGKGTQGRIRIQDVTFSGAHFNCVLKDLKHTVDGSMIATLVIPPQDVDNAISLRHAFNKMIVAGISPRV